ncbi:response regulator, partial [Citrobacter sp. AAK_AS5]
ASLAVPAVWTNLHGHGHILLVDDESLLVELGQDMLEQLGYTVTTSSNGFDALALLQQQDHHFDALITDQTMPGMTGL